MEVHAVGRLRGVRYNSIGNSLLCGGAAQVAAGCDNDWNIWGVGLRTQWAVSSTFQIGLEVLYTRLESATPVGGSITQSGTNACQGRLRGGRTGRFPVTTPTTRTTGRSASASTATSILDRMIAV